MSNDRRQRHEKPVTGLHIDGLTLREHLQRTTGNSPDLLVQHPSAETPAPKSAEVADGKQYDPPWSYLDPDNPNHEHYRHERAAPPPPRADQPIKDAVTQLLDLFEARGKQHPRRQKSLWKDDAREAGIQFSEEAFEKAWLIAVRQKLIIPRKAGAPTKAEQAKRRQRDASAKAQSGKSPRRLKG